MKTGMGSPFLCRTIKSIISFHSGTRSSVSGLQESYTMKAAEEFLKNDWMYKRNINKLEAG